MGPVELVELVEVGHLRHLAELVEPVELVEVEVELVELVEVELAVPKQHSGDVFCSPSVRGRSPHMGAALWGLEEGGAKYVEEGGLSRSPLDWD